MKAITISGLELLSKAMLNFIKANMLWVVVGCMLLAAYIYSATAR